MSLAELALLNAQTPIVTAQESTRPLARGAEGLGEKSCYLF